MADIRIIGAGKMGANIAHPLAKAHSLSFYDKQIEKAQALAHEYNAAAVSSPFQGVSQETIVLLAIKPQDFVTFLEVKAPSQFHSLISILTGVTLSTLESAFPSIPIFRMMPNLAVRSGEGVVALATSQKTSSLLREEISHLFLPLGLVKWFPESQFDGVTSLTGSGPGFFFVLVEAMIDAGIAMGFSHEDAFDLAKQMIAGSLSIMKETGKLPGELKWQVTSPGGTTIAGLRKLEEKGVRSGLIETFLAAYERSKSLFKISPTSDF